MLFDTIMINNITKKCSKYRFHIFIRNENKEKMERKRYMLLLSFHFIVLHKQETNTGNLQ